MDDKRVYQIGKRIGAGAHGSVHKILERGRVLPQWVVKCAPLPTGRTKKEMKIIANLLCNERQMYAGILGNLQGTMIPRVPHTTKPPSFGDKEGTYGTHGCDAAAAAAATAYDL